MATIGIIPARGGSKGIPRKNIRRLNGKPLLAYSIEHAKDTEGLERVVVSTDDQEIAELAGDYDVEVIIRPEELATDSARTLPVVQHVLGQIDPRRVYDKIVLLQPTSPLRRVADIDQAITLLEPVFDSVMSVCQVRYSPYKMYHLENHCLIPIFSDSVHGTPRQELPPVYRENGAVYVTWRQIIDHGSLLGTRIRPLILDQESALDIDDELDLKIAELLIRQAARGRECKDSGRL